MNDKDQKARFAAWDAMARALDDAGMRSAWALATYRPVLGKGIAADSVLCIQRDLCAALRRTPIGQSKRVHRLSHLLDAASYLYRDARGDSEIESDGNNLTLAIAAQEAGLSWSCKYDCCETRELGPYDALDMARRARKAAAK